MAISNQSQFLAAGDNEGEILLLNLKTEQKHAELNSHSDAVYSLSFSPDGQFIASGSRDDTVKIWHVKTGKLLHTLKEDSRWYGVFSVSFSKDGQVLAAGLGGGEIKLWQKI
ncbi:WD40 repeat domain-containing protein [Leptolyngbya sp. AN03gr2]|uniref:WD40 repeat domain-containing protein n=1 Tax=Leptolyngbya sp. AN03gr2 TaxID=3423364 RepID=UPI003D3183EC